MPLKITITGSSGFIGSGLTSFLKSKGHDVFSLNRPYNLDAMVPTLEGSDCVIHLSGESIASRWNEEKKRKIFDSRIISTKSIVEAFSKLNSKPKIFICASGVGYYGYSCGDKELNETSPLGEGFLAHVCEEWESEAQKASSLGIRVVNTRFGLVISPKGGALKKMLLPFKLGLGGVLGDGSQYMSWIAYEDVLLAINHCIINESISGPINFCSSNPVTNYEFTKSLGKALKRPTIFPIPKIILSLIFGEMAKETLLASQSAFPKKLLESGYTFQVNTLQDCLKF